MVERESTSSFEVEKVHAPPKSGWSFYFCLLFSVSCLLVDLLYINSGLLLLPVNRHDDFSVTRFDITFEVKDLLPGS